MLARVIARVVRSFVARGVPTSSFAWYLPYYRVKLSVLRMMNPPAHDGINQRRVAILELTEAGQQRPEDRGGLDFRHPGAQF